MNEKETLDLIARLRYEKDTLALKLAARTTALANVELDRESLRSMLKSQNNALRAIRGVLNYEDKYDEKYSGGQIESIDEILKELGL